MEIKVNNIVRRIGTNEVFEITEVHGKVILGKPINVPSLKQIAVPLTEQEVEIIMDEETDVFNLLFKD